jgi:uncharacterized membrane protein YecN with MAPEG domain
MAEQVHETPDAAVPQAGEAIHMPEPSYLPVAVAFGIAIALIGVITTWVISILGLLILVPAVVRWIGRTRGEMADLPLEH